MKFIPAIDLKDNQCVRLKKGKKDSITVFNKNPIEQAKFFEKNGCKRIHIVDLDGAFGNKDINTKTILEIRKNIKIQIELGGGIKNIKDISFWLDRGIDFLIVGSLAVKEKDVVKNIQKKYLKKIYVALDIFQQKVMIKGWTEDSKTSVKNIIDFYNSTLIKGYILTDISRDGMLSGLDINLIQSLMSLTTKDVIVGGGLSSYKDLLNLKNILNINLEGVIAGKAFYSGNIKIDEALKIINSNA